MRGQEQKSYVASGKTFQREWFVVDATDRVLGRMATRVATVLMGKHKPTYTPFLDTGDHVIILNAEKVRLTGKKPQKKVYNTFSGYPSGNRFIPFQTWFSKHPERVVRHAVLDMLPRGTLGRQMISKLHVYRGDKHPHQAQKPTSLTLG
jgi:large subunit ribosomal protein L13